jgi:hypothetical protein
MGRRPAPALMSLGTSQWVKEACASTATHADADLVRKVDPSPASRQDRAERASGLLALETAANTL